jgi:hypothetical protein
MIEINEVIRRSDQGVTRPFVCRDATGRQLWVKGRAWATRELAAEWICARLAHIWGLPLADYSLVSVADDLIRLSAVPEIASLGSGIGFGSFHAEGAAELDYADIQKIDAPLRAEILLFDYWVQNGDRILGEHGGNPNLLWQAHQDRLVVIDHNAAFFNGFYAPEFFRTHIFHDSLVQWDAGFREKHHKKLLEFLDQLPDIWGAIPEEWFADDDLTGFSAELSRMKDVLTRMGNDVDAFWEVCV